jgi:hypothetical protein
MNRATRAMISPINPAAILCLLAYAILKRYRLIGFGVRFPGKVAIIRDYYLSPEDWQSV